MKITIPKNEKAGPVMIKKIWAILLVFSFAMLLHFGCYIPGLDALGNASDPPGEGGVTGVDETYYGKFFIYQVGNGQIFNLGGSRVNYLVGETYLPGNGIEDLDLKDYNIMHVGDGNYSLIFIPVFGYVDPDQTFFYKDNNANIRPASFGPEGIVLNGSLALYYTNWDRVDTFPVAESVCANDLISNVPPGAAATFNSYSRALMQHTAMTQDVDVFNVVITDPGTVVNFRLLNSQFTGKHPLSDDRPADGRHRLSLTLYDSLGAKLGKSRTGVDYWRWVDPALSYNFQVPGTYYIYVEDMLSNVCGDGGNPNDDGYWLFVESPNYNQDVNRLMKGEIQPARSGNPLLSGQHTFEPDDLATKIDDHYPDCDEIPGTGDEGDSGVFEDCFGYSDLGAHDGLIQYQEVDDKKNIDDGEYFQGVQTNVGVVFASEASLVNTPDRDSLLMFINYGSRIYMLESLDGQDGLVWDTSNVLNDRPAVLPRGERGDVGNPDDPVISSGPIGFCDSVPDPLDEWAAPQMKQYADAYGVTATADGQVANAPIGYPDTYAVTYGSNNHLDSAPLVDTQQGNTIYSGPDGIINTFFAPRYIGYSRPPFPYSLDSSVYGIGGYDILPGDTQLFHGPGRPDDPPIFILDFGIPFVGYINPLAAPPYNGSNQGGYLLGDDLWNPDIFKGNTLTPPEYLQKQHCRFYSMGLDFDKCAMGVPQDENGNEPVAIQAGADGRLDTVDVLLNGFRGDDYLCRQGDTVGICAGVDGNFGWEDIYLPIRGDDRLELVRDTFHTVNDFPGIKSVFWTEIRTANAGLSWPERFVIGVGPGPDGILQTGVISSYTVVDPNKWLFRIGGDRICETIVGGLPAICPGVEVEIDMYWYIITVPFPPPYLVPPPFFTTPTPVQTRKIYSVWPMYLTSPDKQQLWNGNPGDFEPGMYTLMYPRKDNYDFADDEFCQINGELAVCPGDNRHFQSYPMSQRVLVDVDDDLFKLYKRAAGYLIQDCYSMRAETYQDTWSDDEKVRYVLYRNYGVRGDDRVKWDAVNGFHVTTGPNGINQSCAAQLDVKLIGLNKGLPNMPIISANPVGLGGDGVLSTYPLADEKVYWGDGVWKISTGDDGVSNSFAMGDDNLEIYLGAGQADQPCVLSGDGVADTYAQMNDTQLYSPGDPLDPTDNEVTGFDAFQVWGPDALVVGQSVLLYYTALGWGVLPPSFRDGQGALGDLGECHRPGIDYEWGRNRPQYSLPLASDDDKQYAFDMILTEGEFRRSLDNNQGVYLGPRIGLATSTIARLRADPTDWTFNNKPALDLGQQCVGSLSFPIELPGFELPGLVPDANWNGAFSPDVKVTKASDEESLLFLMFFSGLATGEAKENIQINSTQVGLARSLDGINWEIVRDLNPVLSLANLDLSSLLSGSSPQYAFPSVVFAGSDEYGEPMYGMFFNEFETRLGQAPGWDSNVDYDLKTRDHIGYALRKGKAYLACSVSSDYWADHNQRLRSILQIVIILVPLLLVVLVRFFRRETN